MKWNKFWLNLYNLPRFYYIYLPLTFCEIGCHNGLYDINMNLVRIFKFNAEEKTCMNIIRIVYLLYNSGKQQSFSWFWLVFLVLFLGIL